MSTELKTLNGYGFDATKLGGLDAQYYAQGRAAHNLLDNSDFRNPVNQRGQTSWTNWNNYTVDRWIFRNNPVSEASVGVSGMSITTGSSEIYLEQAFNKSAKQFYIGKPLTLVFSTNEGLLIKKWTVVDGSYSREPIGNLQMTIGCLTNFWIDFVVPANKTINIYWAALYEGSYTADTLPAYVPKGYAAELAACQRYYWRYWQNNNMNIGYGYMNTADTANITFDFPTKMRIAPTITIGDISTLRVMCVDGLKGTTGYSVVRTTDKQMIVGFTLNNTSTPFTPCVMRSNSGTTIEFSADL